MDLESLFPVIFPIVFVLMWVGVDIALAKMSGWEDLSDRYKATCKPQEMVFYLQNGKLGSMSINNCLTIRGGSEGLYLSLFPLLLFNSRILIPWEEVEKVIGDSDQTQEKYCDFALGKPKTHLFSLPQKVTKKITEFGWLEGERGKEGI